MTYNPLNQLSEQFERGSTSQLVSNNERNLLRIIRQHPGISRSEITVLTDLTQQSVYRLIDALKVDELLQYGDPKPGTGRGQPSPTIRLNSDYAFTAGISVSTDNINVCLLDFAGNVRSSEKLNIYDLPMEEGLSKIKGSLDNQLKAHSVDANRLFGAGFAIEGYLQEGSTYNAPLPLHEWSMIELGPLVSERLGIPVWTANAANTSAMCEAMLGVGKYVSNFAYLSINYGFGGAMILNGELWKGAYGNAGEMSAMYNMSQYGKRPALQFLMKYLQKNGIAVQSIDQIRHSFDPKWPGVKEWVEEATPALNDTLNAIAAIMDPEAIVFGGQLPPKLADQLVTAAEFYRRPRYGYIMKTPKLIVSNLESNASSVGAALLPLKEVYF
ncbi:putative ROK family transcriptional regulator [Vibrio nigripulchritudo MADA3029]|uniref:ROK family transcriptional regulator n=1 Tax=Vibrio nigripulchritudo TaxID=28173 RepID=UPI0003B19F70|nr:ROK family transcriptional regulator [Vibrio nigripulchritudo]CCN50708.1 putative ROK family transcriptional regulator [Vibrio nigripulchritudo MADA3020]CCN52279.1 putative ROK family transcriptional regulator [Vibrio nigripulchritudo MADA3021]CCN59159.1 putative ROK family transcriptional regulator [Vibrio nigripulchritudo MADA3029]